MRAIENLKSAIATLESLENERNKLKSQLEGAKALRVAWETRVSAGQILDPPTTVVINFSSSSDAREFYQALCVLDGEKPEDSTKETDHGRFPKSSASIKPTGFDVGRGFFKEGDYATYNGCKVSIVSVFNDGSADIAFPHGGRKNVKWHELSKING